MGTDIEDDGPAQGLEIATRIGVEKEHVAKRGRGTVRVVMDTGELDRAAPKARSTKHIPPNAGNIDVAALSGGETDLAVKNVREIARAVLSGGRTTPDDGVTVINSLHPHISVSGSESMVKMTAKGHRTGDGKVLRASLPIMIVEVTWWCKLFSV
jgi:hypothetical protein